MSSDLGYYETLRAIDGIKKHLESQLEERLSLTKVQCPIFVKSSSGLQDSLTGVEKSLSFDKEGETFEIVHSLAKWKRDALGRYAFPVGAGLYTDMKAIRKDETVDDIHSLFVEQYDWEKVIERKDRNIEFLKMTVREIYEAIKDTLRYVKSRYDHISVELPQEVTFIGSQELEDMYPKLSPKEREERITREKRAVFIIGIGEKLRSGVEHDLRSPDYDDWQLDGDLLVFDDVLDKPVELTSMGIRVDENSLISQLEKAGCMDRLSLPYHQKIANGQLPYTIGGGIGISRILMLMLEKTHIAEVQPSSWQQKTLDTLKGKKIL